MPNLREQLTTSFDKSELKNLCYDLNINHDELAGETLSDKAQSLITYCERRGRVPDLLTHCQQLRPNINWQHTPALTTYAVTQPKRKFFVGHVYDKRLIDDLRDAIAKATEDTPWQPVYADEQVISGHILFNKITPLIAECEFSLFEISNQTRPNVFIELGLALQQKKTVYLLLEHGVTPPSDLAGLDHIPYRSFKELTTTLKQKVFSKNPTQLLQRYVRHTYHVNAISLRQDLSLIASGSGDRNAILWNVVTGDVRAIYKHNSWVGSVQFAPNARYLATSDGKGNLRIWDITQTNTIFAQKAAHEGACRTIAFSPDGQFLASGGEDTYIHIWRFPSLEKVSSLTVHTSEVRRLAFSPDGNKLASCGEDGKCVLWSIPENKHHILFENRNNLLRSIAYSGDGRLIAVTDSDGYVWFVQQVANGEWITKSIKAHEGPTAGLSIHPSSQIVATGGQDKIIRFWHAQTGKQINDDVIGHEDTVTCLIFSPDGKWLISGSRDKSLCLWDAKLEALLP